MADRVYGAPIDVTRLSSLYGSHVSLREIEKTLRIGNRRLKREISRLDLFRETMQPSRAPNPKLVGTKFHSLTVSGFTHDMKTNQWWMQVVCDCGRKSNELLSKLKRGLRKTCGVKGCRYFHQIRQANGRKANFTGYKEIYGSRWAGWRCGAEKRGIEFSITPKYAWRIFLKQNRKCALTDIDLSFGNSYTKCVSASLDRKNSLKGYIKGNVQWVHKTVNLMKRSMTDEEFIRWCHLVSKKAFRQCGARRA